jgi:uncharacterized protein (TIGR03067 family)
MLAATTAMPVWAKEVLDDETTSLRGEWMIVGMEDDGNRASGGEIDGMKWSIQGSTITATDPDGSSGKMSFKLEQKKSPKEIQVTPLDGNLKGIEQVGIYELKESRLRICF